MLSTYSTPPLYPSRQHCFSFRSLRSWEHVSYVPGTESSSSLPLDHTLYLGPQLLQSPSHRFTYNYRGNPIRAFREGKGHSWRSLVASSLFLEELLEKIKNRTHVDQVAVLLEWRRSRSSETSVRIRGHR